MQSSANKQMDDCLLLSMSFIYTKNIKGPRTMPWGIPDITSTSLDKAPSTITLWVLPASQAESYLSIEFWTP